MLRLLALLLLAAGLTGCSYEYPVEAVFVDRHVTFIQRDEEKTFEPWCIDEFKVADVDGTTMWEFNAYDAYRTAATCGPFFPMRYGDAPRGAKVVQPARRLASGRTYIITGHARGMLSGVFTYHERLQRSLTTYGRDTPEALDASERYWSTQGATDTLLILRTNRSKTLNLSRLHGCPAASNGLWPPATSRVC